MQNSNTNATTNAFHTVGASRRQRVFSGPRESAIRTAARYWGSEAYTMIEECTCEGCTWFAGYARR